MRVWNMTMALAATLTLSLPASGQVAVKRVGPPTAAIATAVWAGDLLYVSGQLPNPVTPADPAKGTPAVYGNTKAQAESSLKKIEAVLKEQGLTMGDVVVMHVYLAADPAMDNKMDFAGMNASYSQFFGTAQQPNKPARSTVQVAALVAAGALVEIDAVAARSK
jgi:enamine deaminase RidA (YjgF/YER057c/UK114 family)